MSAIPATLHYCPQCWQELVSGVTKDGEPRICKLCILENVRVKAAFPYLHQSDEPEEKPEGHPEEEQPAVRTVPAPHVMFFILVCGFFCGMCFIAGFMAGRMWPQ